MSRSAVGAITLTDVQDGLNPIAIVLSNQSHTFAADTSKTVTNDERDAFSCEVFVFLGDTRITFDNAVEPANSTYQISMSATNSWVATHSEVSNQAVIVVSTIGDTTTSVITVTVDVKNSLGVTTSVDMLISLAKAIEGSSGAIVNIVPSRQTFRYDSDGVTTDDDITLSITSDGNTGALSASYATNGSTSYSTLSVGTDQGEASSVDVDGSDPDTIVITPDNFGTYDVLTIKVSGASQGSDVVSIVKIQDGNTGEAAVTVVITSSVGGSVFKNNTGVAKTLTASVYDMSDGAEITSDITYQWKKNGDNVESATASTLEVTASDVTDGGSEEYTCHVIVS